MKKDKITYFLFAVSFLFVGCDKVDDPIPKGLGTSLTFGGVEHIVADELNINDSAGLATFIDNNTWIEKTAPDNSTRRFIVLEEFTGHKCLFCPKGTREIVRLDSIYKELLIPVGIHAGGFARPRSGDKYTTDFRVEGNHGEEYKNKYNPDDAYPRAVISRTAERATSDATWGNSIAAIINDIPLATLELTTYFDSTNSIIRANCKVLWKKTLAENYNLQLFVVEDHIIDWQLDGSVDVEFYDHRHVLRKVVNGTFGKSLKTAIAGENEEIQYVFPFTEALRANNKKNIEVVAFIFDNDPASDLNVIIQGNAIKVLE